jgi:hypothetical protein
MDSIGWVPRATPGQTLDQAITFGIEEVWHIFSLEGVPPPPDEEIRSELERRAGRA